MAHGQRKAQTDTEGRRPSGLVSEIGRDRSKPTQWARRRFGEPTHGQPDSAAHSAHRVTEEIEGLRHWQAQTDTVGGRRQVQLTLRAARPRGPASNKRMGRLEEDVSSRNPATVEL